MRKGIAIAVVSIGICLSCIVSAAEKGQQDEPARDPGTRPHSEGSPHGKTAAQTTGSEQPLDRNEAKGVIVARVNGTAITRQSVIDMMNRLSVQKRHAVRTPEEKEALEKEALERLVFEELAYQKGRSEGLKAEPAEVDKEIESLRKKMGGEAAFKEALERQMFTEEELRADFERSIVLQRVFQKEVFDKVSVTEEELQKEYEKEKAKFITPEKMVIADVVFFLSIDEKDSLEKAESILNQIRQDKDANPLNLVPDGTFIAYEAEISKKKQPELYEKARKLTPGELSGVFKTVDSLHIIKLREYMPEKQFSYTEMRGFLEKQLTDVARLKGLRKWETELIKGATIEILETQGSKK